MSRYLPHSSRTPVRRVNLLAWSLLAVATLSSAAILSSDDSGAPGTQAALASTPALAPPLPLLWKVSDADNSVYLLGSFHLLKSTDYPVSADIDAAFSAAEQVVFEVTPEQLDDPANAQKFLAAAGYGDARTLSTVLPSGLRGKLDAMLARKGGSVAKLDGFEPWFVNLSLVLGMAQSIGFSTEHGLDRHLMQKAAAAGKPIGGLETLDVQLRALDSAPMPEQIVGLAEFVNRPEDMPGMLGDLHDAWRQGDVERLDQVTRAEMQAKTPATYRQINVERNDAWTPKLQAMLDGSDDADTLVVVGALHLLGDDGVVAKLRAKGYDVERICSACANPAAATSASN